MPTAKQWGLVAAVLWGVAALVSIPFFGIVGILNVPRWLLHLIEAVEYIPFVLAGNNPLAVLGALGRSQEAAMVVVGIPAFAAWLAGLGATISLGRGGQWRHAALVGVCAVVVSPITSGEAAYWVAWRIPE